MASKLFHELLEQLHEAGEKKPLRWEPVKRSSYSSRCDFYLALGGSVICVSSKDDDEETYGASYKAALLTRDGLLVDELETSQITTDYSTLLRDLYRQARSAAFNLPRMLEDIRADLAAGKTRELPEKLVRPDESDIPF